MPQPKSSPAEMSMPTFATLEEWTRSQVQELMQSVLEEEITHVLGRARYERRALLDAPRGHRNGYGKPRRLSFTSDTIEVKRPRVRGLESSNTTPGARDDWTIASSSTPGRTASMSKPGSKSKRPLFRSSSVR